MERLEAKLDSLRSIFEGRRVLVLLSGGVDSSVLLAIARRYAREVVALTFTSEVFPEEVIERARELCRSLGVRHVEVELDVLSSEDFVRNDSQRCYVCKRMMCQRALAIAREIGADMIVDGTNASDLLEERPGIRALREFGVLSPLAVAGITKDEVRELARRLGIRWYDAPPESCYATRITGRITAERIRRVRAAEKLVRALTGATLVRARDMGDLVKIELSGDEIWRIFSIDVLSRLTTELRKLGFKYVTIDAAGYHDSVLARARRKLVRDKIPEITRRRFVVRVVRGRERFEHLVLKLWEEVYELSRNPSPEEIADVLEVLMSLASELGVAWDAVEELRRRKREARGGFDGGIVIEWLD